MSGVRDLNAVRGATRLMALLLLVVGRADAQEGASTRGPKVLAHEQSDWRNPRTVVDMKTDDNEIELVWSDPVLIEDFAYRLPVPDHFYVFDDDRHMFGAWR